MKTLSELYQEIETHLMHDEKPSEYLNQLEEEALFRQYPFDMLTNLKHTMQSEKHHPEGNAWNHTLLVVDEAAKVKYQSKNPKVFMWAALLHDIGKGVTTKIRKGKITSYDHDKIGATMAKEFLIQFTDDSHFVKDVKNLVRYHMQILFVTKGLPFADVDEMLHDTDIEEVALLGYCDRMGRFHINPKVEKQTIEKFLKVCSMEI